MFPVGLRSGGRITPDFVVEIPVSCIQRRTEVKVHKYQHQDVLRAHKVEVLIVRMADYRLIISMDDNDSCIHVFTTLMLQLVKVELSL